MTRCNLSPFGDLEVISSTCGDSLCARWPHAAETERTEQSLTLMASWEEEEEEPMSRTAAALTGRFRDGEGDLRGGKQTKPNPHIKPIRDLIRWPAAAPNRSERREATERETSLMEERTQRCVIDLLSSQVAAASLFLPAQSGSPHFWGQTVFGCALRKRRSWKCEFTR